MRPHRAPPPVDDGDHVRGVRTGPAITVIEYGDYECPHTRRANGIVNHLLAENTDVVLVFRHFPLRHLHPNAEILSRIAEAADRQAKFWSMHDHLMSHPKPVDERGVVADAETVGVDLQQLLDGISDAAVIARVQRDIDGGRAAGVHSTPSFFFDGVLHDGHYDDETLSSRLREARGRRSPA